MRGPGTLPGRERDGPFCPAAQGDTAGGSLNDQPLGQDTQGCSQLQADQASGDASQVTCGLWAQFQSQRTEAMHSRLFPALDTQTTSVSLPVRGGLGVARGPPPWLVSSNTDNNKIFQKSCAGCHSKCFGVSSQVSLVTALWSKCCRCHQQAQRGPVTRPRPHSSQTAKLETASLIHSTTEPQVPRSGPEVRQKNANRKAGPLA